MVVFIILIILVMVFGGASICAALSFERKWAKEHEQPRKRAKIYRIK